MRILKANTAVRLVVGPLCDKTTGLAKTGMTVTNMAMNMWHEHDDGSAPTKSIDAVSFTASGGNNDMVELAGGYYDIEITAAQVNITAGRCGFLIYDDDVILPYFEEWLVVPANVFDSIMGTDTLDVNVTTLADDVITSAKFDESTAFPVKSADTGATAIARVGADSDTLETLSDEIAAVKAETALIVADTGTDGVLVSSGTGAKQISLSSGAVVLQGTQGAITWAQQKIVANVAGEGALDIENTNATGIGTMNEAPSAGMFNKATGASGSGLLNNSTNASGVGQKNYAGGASSFGILNVGTLKNVSGFDSAQALEATLTAIKGAGWGDETLVALMTAIEGISAGSGAIVADILNALLASYTVSGSVGESLGRLDNIQAKTDLITTGTTITIASPVSGSTITAQRGDTLSAALENIGALTNHSKLYFTVKWDAADADTAALIQIEHTAGLLYINGAAAVTAANGTLTVDDEATGDITIGLAAVEAAKLPLGSYSYDVQIVRSAGTVSTLTSGNFTVSADVTRAVT